MKAFISLQSACLLMVFFVTSSAMAQFVTLDGRQFKDGNGNDWYPMVMDYFLSIYCQPPSSTCCDLTTAPTIFWPAPAAHYGPTIGLEPNQFTASGCLMDLNSDFALIRNMGFNSVRITSGVHWNNATSGFELETFWSKPNCNCTYSLPFTFPWDQPLPGETKSNTDKYFEILDQLIETAATNDLLVMLDIILFNKFHSFSNEMETDLLSYLHYFGSHFKDNTNVFCYCTFEEIGLNDLTIPPHSKQYVCNFTTACYDVLKQADPNHLISISGGEISDVGDWDPAAMKMDFYQPHIYPEIGNQPSGYQDVNAGINRYKSKLYWLSKNCPVPWLIGETGFRANDEFYDGSHVHPFAYPMDGNEAEQLLYAQQSVEATYAYGGSGYSWFMYQDGWNKDIPNNINAPDGHGILRQGLVPYPPFPSGNPSSPLFTFEKPVGNYFRYLQHPQTVVSQPSVNEPGNYFDPYGTASQNSANTNRVYGYVTQGNTGINDAVVFAWNYIESHLEMLDPYTSIEILDEANQIYTFTKNNENNTGYFEIEPFNHKYPTTPSKQRIIKVWASATSANSSGCSVGTYGPKQITEPNPVPFPMELNSINQDVIIDGETFQANSSNRISAWNSILVSNSSFSGNPNNNGLIELNARSVRIMNETHLANGSEVRIKASVVTPICDDFTNQSQQKPFESPLTKSLLNNNQEIKLQFLPTENYMADIFPNPCQTQFTIQTYMGDNEQFTVTLTDLIGNIIITESFISNTFIINIQDLAKGIYLLKLTNGDSATVKKIIKN